MSSWVYDFEVYCKDWLVDFKNRETKQHFTFVNDNQAVRDFINQEDLYFGFNSKGYDQYIMKAVCNGFEPEELKQLNDWIISGEQGWLYPPLRDCYFKFNNVDITDDMQMGLSLKAIEGHLGKPIVESSVPFDIDRKLTDDEIREVIKYCRYDVDMTDELIDLRKDYLNSKIMIGKMCGLSAAESLSKTNAKLTACLLGAKRKEWKDERDYQYPSNLKRELIPDEVFEFFDKLKDENIGDEVFNGKLEFAIGECKGVIGYGGIHSAIPNYRFGGDEK